MEQINLRVSRDAIEEFKESILWADIVEELNSWKTGFELERGSIVDDAAETNPSTASILLHLGDISGRIKAVDYMLSIPDVFLGLLDTKKEDK
jgi:hypothetical protein